MNVGKFLPPNFLKKILIFPLPPLSEEYRAISLALAVVNLCSLFQYPADISRLRRRGQTGGEDGETEARLRTAGRQPSQVCLLWQEEH